MQPLINTINRAKVLTERGYTLQEQIEQFITQHWSDLDGQAGGRAWAARDLVRQCWCLSLPDDQLFELDLMQDISAEDIVTRFQESQRELPDATEDTREWSAIRLPISLENMMDKCESFLNDAESLFAEAQRLHHEPAPYYQPSVESSGPHAGCIEFKTKLRNGSVGMSMEVPVRESLRTPLNFVTYRGVEITTAEAAVIDAFNDLEIVELSDDTVAVRPTRWYGQASGAIFIRYENGLRAAFQLTFQRDSVTIDKL